MQVLIEAGIWVGICFNTLISCFRRILRLMIDGFVLRRSRQIELSIWLNGFLMRLVRPTDILLLLQMPLLKSHIDFVLIFSVELGQFILQIVLVSLRHFIEYLVHIFIHDPFKNVPFFFHDLRLCFNKLRLRMHRIVESRLLELILVPFLTICLLLLLRLFLLWQLFCRFLYILLFFILFVLKSITCFWLVRELDLTLWDVRSHILGSQIISLGSSCLGLHILFVHCHLIS